MNQIMRRALLLGVQEIRFLTLRIEVARLKLVNRFSASQVISPDGPVVSMATYGQRLKTVFLAIESIGRGTVRPVRLLLWLSHPDEYANLPVEIQRLQKRGLEVRLSDRDYGPHKKYYPYLQTRDAEASHGPLVTADDDVLYPRDWLQGLSEAHRRSPSLIQCYRARVVQLTGDGFAPYASWPLCRSDQPSPRVFPIGVSGVLYPAPFLELVRMAGNAFEQTCPRADDLWLHRNAIRNGFAVRQLTANPVHFLIIPGTQAEGLQQQNLHNKGNDAQAKATYTVADIAVLRGAAPIETPPESCKQRVFGV